MGFKLRLRLYTPSGTRGRVIPTVTLAPDLKFGDLSTCQATVSAAAYSNLPAFPIVAALEVSNGAGWSEPANGRFIFQGDDLDAVDPAQVRTLTGAQFVPWMLQRACLQAWAGINSNGQRPIPANIGAIVDLMTEAHNRGWGSFITTDATESKDSSGAPATGAASLLYSLGTPLWQNVTDLFTNGNAEFTTTGNVLHLWNVGHGTDLSASINVSHDATTVPVKRDWSGVRTAVTIAGDDNLLVQTTNAGAPSTFGRLEGWLSQSGVKSASDATSLGQKTLSQMASPNREVQVTADAHAMPNLPWVDYQLGDWVKFRADQGWEKGRVVEIVASQNQDGTVSLTTIFGDRSQTLLAKLAKQAAATTGGAASGGTGKPITIDPTPPDAAGGLTGSEAGYWDKGVPRARVSLSWTAVTTGYSGNAPVDVNTYQVWMRLDGQATSSSLATVDTNSLVRDGLPVGTTAYFQVRALSSQGVWGPLTAEYALTLTAPTDRLPAPSTPSFLVAPQGVYAHWDGLLGGVAPARSFSYVYAITSTTEAGSYAPVGGSLSSAGDILLPSSGAVWVRLVAVDLLGQESDWSAAAQVTAQPAVPVVTVASNTGAWVGEQGVPQGVVVLTWPAVTVDILGNPATVDWYEVWSHHGVDDPPMLYVTVTSSTATLTLPPDVDVQFQVRAHATTGVFSDFTSDVDVTPAHPTDALPAPSTPLLTTDHSALSAAWDGGTANGTAWPVQFWHVVAQVAPDVAGSPGDYVTVSGQLVRAGSLTIPDVNADDVLWVQFVAYDHLGVASPPSPPAQITVVGIPGDQIVAGSITTNQLSPTIGDEIDINGNVTITSVQSSVEDVQSGLDDTNDALAVQQTAFQVAPDGVSVYSPGGTSAVLITDDEIDLQVAGVTVSYWNQQVMNVNSIVITKAVIGSVQFEAQSTRTVMRAL